MQDLVDRVINHRAAGTAAKEEERLVLEGSLCETAPGCWHASSGVTNS